MSSQLNLRAPNQPHILVLIATYNGAPWLEQQVRSILNQRGVNVQLVISDDNSTDNTVDCLNMLAKKHTNIAILPKMPRVGAAGKNFYRLILDTDITGFDHIAFADQDDIWHENKLTKHVALAKLHQADGVSSNVLAFWPNSTKKLIVKSQPQRKYDFLFESAGPGCTFLMTPWLVNQVRTQLNDVKSLARDVAFHDWLVYAICRAHGHKWVIDAEPSLEYRQHQANTLGANSGLNAKWARLISLKQGWYRTEVGKVCQVACLLSNDKNIMQIALLVKNRTLSSMFKLLWYLPELRRSFFDRLALGLTIFLF